MKNLDIKHFESKIEPKKKDRFIINLPEELRIPSYLIKSIEFKEVYSSLAQKFEFELEIYETTDISVLQILKNKMASQINDYSKFNIEVFLIDAVGVCLNTWKLNGCFITEVSLPSLSYENSDPIMIKIKINSDYFEIE
jgi:hypothetical protein